MNPDEMEKGNPLPDDFDFTIKEATWVIYDYAGKSGVEVPALWVLFDTHGKYEKDREEHYKAGDLDSWRPSDDGTRLKKVGDEEKIRNNSNAGLFLASLVEGGFPKNRLSIDPTVLVDTQGHAKRQVATNREGFEKKKNKSGQEVEAKILLVTEVTALPGEGAAAKGKSKGANKSIGDSEDKDSTKADGAAEVDAATYLLELLEAADGKSLPKNKIVSAMFNYPPVKKLGGKERNAISKLAGEENFLREGGPWKYENGVASL
jgi:hypothetical protein